jgi:hypothetical protein
MSLYFLYKLYQLVDRFFIRFLNKFHVFVFPVQILSTRRLVLGCAKSAALSASAFSVLFFLIAKHVLMFLFSQISMVKALALRADTAAFAKLKGTF